MCVISRQLCRRIPIFQFSTLDAHIRTTFSHNVKTVRNGRFQLQGAEWQRDFNFVISQFYSTHIPIAT